MSRKVHFAKPKCEYRVFALFFQALSQLCFFPKTSRSTIIFLITVDDSRQLEVAKASDTHSLVQVI